MTFGSSRPTKDSVGSGSWTLLELKMPRMQLLYWLLFVGKWWDMSLFFKVMVGVYGPREIARRSDFSMRGNISCDLKFSPFACRSRRGHQVCNASHYFKNTHTFLPYFKNSEYRCLTRLKYLPTCANTHKKQCFGCRPLLSLDQDQSFVSQRKMFDKKLS